MTIQRELIIITKPNAGLRAAQTAVASVTNSNVDPLNALLTSSSATIRPVFGNENRMSQIISTPTAATALNVSGVPNLSTFYRLVANDDQLNDLVENLRNLELVDGAYIKPAAQPPVFIEESIAPPDAQEAPPATPDFVSSQLYLEAAPGGIDARFAWTVPGGKGQGIGIIDIEGAWRFSHEDLIQNQGGAIGGTQSADIGWRNHGTAVTGEFGGDETSFGVTGICPQANVRAISIFGAGQGSAKAITDAANALNPGDIILIELHAPGPRHNFTDVGGQLGFIAMEFWPDNFAAIIYATAVRGVIVVEAGGNGAENFDDPLYDNHPMGFPATWRNPFNLANPQSGAIIVGAGAPPPGTHGRNHGADRSRLGFSNYGARVDVQGWGREVTTAGYGNLQGGSNEDFWYTDTFSGTSSASPIVVGVIGSLQGALRAAGKTLLTPATAHDILRNTGSPQQDEPGRPATQRIGNRPDLRQALTNLVLGSGWWEWESLGGVLSYGPDVCSWAEGRLDVFAQGTDNALWHKWFDGGWWEWELLGGFLTSDPTAVSWSNGRIDTFARGGDNALWHKWFDGGWWEWESLGGVLSSGPDVCSWATGRLDVFAQGTDNALWHKWFDGGWWEWESLGGFLTSDPTAVSWSNGRIDIFARGGDNALWHKWFDGGWWEWESLGGVLSSGPDVCSWATGRLDVFAQGTDNALWHKWFDGGWSEWESLGGFLTSDPTAVSWSNGRIDTFARGGDNALWHKWFGS